MFSWNIVFTFVVAGAGAFFGAYLSEKAKNFASKEDLSGLTSIVEGVKFRFDEFLEQSRQKHQLRMAALDLRLAKHQEAYALWRRMLHSSGKERETIVMECQTWWENNCLYLEPTAREAFFKAFHAAFDRDDLFRSTSSPRTDQEMQMIKNNFETIESAGRVIASCIALPPLAGETSPLASENQPCPGGDTA